MIPLTRGRENINEVPLGREALDVECHWKVQLMATRIGGQVTRRRNRAFRSEITGATRSRQRCID